MSRDISCSCIALALVSALVEKQKVSSSQLHCSATFNAATHITVILSPRISLNHLNQASTHCIQFPKIIGFLRGLRYTEWCGLLWNSLTVQDSPTCVLCSLTCSSKEFTLMLSIYIPRSSAGSFAMHLTIRSRRLIYNQSEGADEECPAVLSARGRQCQRVWHDPREAMHGILLLPPPPVWRRSAVLELDQVLLFQRRRFQLQLCSGTTLETLLPWFFFIL